MRLSKRHLVAVGVLGALVVGFGAAASVIAAIPHSATKVISACRDNTTGALKVIDAENAGTCGGSETLLTWSGAQTAIAKVDYDQSDPYGPGVYNATQSRNIAGYDAVTPVGYDAGYCIHLNFAPKYTSPVSTFSIYDNDSANTELLEEICGPGYEYYFVSNSIINIPIFFTE